MLIEESVWECNEEERVQKQSDEK